MRILIALSILVGLIFVAKHDPKELPDDPDFVEVQEYRCGERTHRVYIPNGQGRMFTEDGELIEDKPDCLAVRIGRAEEVGGDVKEGQ